MTGRCLVVLAVMEALFTSFPASAQTLMGAGTSSCGEWLRLRNAENNPGTNYRDLATAYQLVAWIDGYLSGVNMANSDLSPDFLASQPNGSAMKAFVDNYCRSKPLDPIVAAAAALVKELQSRAQRR